MRTLIITPMLPAFSESDRGGLHRRVGTFLHALSAVSDKMEILHLVPADRMGLADDAARLNRTQSNFWGVELNVSLLSRAVRRETAWNHYGLGIIDATAQPSLYPYVGTHLCKEIGRRLDTNPDCIFIHRLDAMIPLIKNGQKSKPVIFDMDDLYHKTLMRTLRSDPWRPGKIPLALQLPALIQAERQAVAQSTLTFVCSDIDKSRLRHLGCRGDVRVVPNAVTPPDVVPGVSNSRNILFLGAHHYRPNRLAAERLARGIWPIVRAEIPDAHLMIAGAGSESLPSSNIGLPGVEHVGFVDDLAKLYADARVICTPLVHGSGTRLKLIEAASYGRPMVSTSMGAEGLAFRDGAEILIGETDAELAAACIALLRDKTLCDRLGTAARQRMLAFYDAAAIQMQVEEMLRSVMSINRTAACMA